MMDTMHKPLAITPHLYQLGTPSFPAYLSMGDVGMIIEGGTGPTFSILINQMKALGIDPKRISSIVPPLRLGDLDGIGGSGQG